MTPTKTALPTFTITRLLDASPEAVFRAWTEPDQLSWFFNPTQPVPAEPIELDLRVGGQWRQMMVIDGETRYMTGGLYLEIEAPHRLVLAWGAVGGWPSLSLDDPLASPIVTLLLEAVGNQTELKLEVRMPSTLAGEHPEWFALMRQGFSVTLDRLVAEFATSRGR